MPPKIVGVQKKRLKIGTDFKNNKFKLFSGNSSVPVRDMTELSKPIETGQLYWWKTGEYKGQSVAIEDIYIDEGGNTQILVNESINGYNHSVDKETFYEKVNNGELKLNE